MLKDLIRELTEPHPENSRINSSFDIRTAEPLLIQLADAKSRRENGASTGSTQSAPLPLDPLIIEQDIIRTIHYTLSAHHRHEIASLPLTEKVKRWADLVESSLAEAHAEEWVNRIRSIFCTFQDLQVACPNCRQGKIWVDEGDQVIRKNAIMICKETLVASCRNPDCASSWCGEDDLRDLATHALPL